MTASWVVCPIMALVSMGELGSWFFSWVTSRSMKTVESMVCFGARVGVVELKLVPAVDATGTTDPTGPRGVVVMGLLLSQARTSRTATVGDGWEGVEAWWPGPDAPATRDRGSGRPPSRPCAPASPRSPRPSPAFGSCAGAPLWDRWDRSRLAP